MFDRNLEPSEFEVHTKEPESQSVGKLNRVVRLLREHNYQERLKKQQAQDENDELRAQIVNLRYKNGEFEAKPILVWRFEDAPPELKSLSTNGGDEDWLALVSGCDAKDWVEPYWLESGGPFGCSSVDKYRLPHGLMVFIGSHA